MFSTAKNTPPKDLMEVDTKQPNLPSAYQKKEISIEFLKLALRQTELELKNYTILEEDLELQLLKNPATRDYAQRIVELEFKEDKTSSEIKELRLLKDPATSAYTKRIIALDNIMNKTYLEQLEADLLENPKFRPYYQNFLRFTENF